MDSPFRATSSGDSHVYRPVTGPPLPAMTQAGGWRRQPRQGVFRSRSRGRRGEARRSEPSGARPIVAFHPKEVFYWSGRPAPVAPMPLFKRRSDEDAAVATLSLFGKPSGIGVEAVTVAWQGDESQFLHLFARAQAVRPAWYGEAPRRRRRPVSVDLGRPMGMPRTACLRAAEVRPTVFRSAEPHLQGGRASTRSRGRRRELR